MELEPCRPAPPRPAPAPPRPRPRRPTRFEFCLNKPHHYAWLQAVGPQGFLRVPEEADVLTAIANPWTNESALDTE